MNYSTMKCIKLAAIVSIAIGLSACSEQKTTEEYIAASKVYIQNLEYGTAIVELKNAVRQAPRNAEARYYLAKAYTEQGSYVSAEKELDKAGQFGFNMELLLPDLIFVKSKLNKAEEVYALIENVDSLNDEQFIVVLTYAGITALNNKELEKAEDYIAQANSISEVSLYSKMGVAYLFHAEDNFSKGIEIIDTVLGESPDFTEALLLKGHLLFSSEQFIQANEVYTKYRQRHPLANYVRFFEVNSLISAEEYEAADIKATELLKRFNNSPLAHQYKAQIEYQKKNYGDARSFANIAAQQGDEFMFAKMIAGLSAYQLGDFEQAYGYLMPFDEYLPLSHPVKKTLISLQFKLGYIAEVDESFNDLDGLTAIDTSFLSFSSQELMKLREFKTAKKLIDKASELEPENAILAAQKGHILLSQKNMSGIDYLEKAIRLDPALTEVELSLAMQYLTNGKDNKAQTIATKWLDSDESKISGYLLQGVIHIKQNLIEKGIGDFEKVIELEPENTAALYNLATISEHKGLIIEAVELYRKVVNISPSHHGALQHLTKLQMSQNKVGDNVALLTRLLKDNPTNINLILGLVQNLRINNELNKAIKLLEANRDKANLPSSYWIILGDSYLQNNQLEQANNVFQKSSFDMPSNYILQLRYIGMLELNKKYDKALNTTKKAYTFFPGNVRLEMLLAHFELLNNHPEKAKKQLNILANKKIEHSFINKIYGNLAMSQKEYSLAIEHFSVIYEKNPNSKNVIKLARALKFNNQQSEAEQLLESFMTTSPNDIIVRVLLSELYESNTQGSINLEKITEHYQKLSDMQPNNFIALNNLAWNQYKLQRNTLALSNIEKAYALQPRHRTVLESYGVILVANHQYTRGIEVIKKAIDLGSQDITSRVSLAEALIDEHNYNDAAKLLSQVETDDEEVKAKIKRLQKQLD